MKTLTYSIFLALIFCTVTLIAPAQNTKYLLLEYIKLEPGITDTMPIIENTRKKIQLQKQKDASVLWSSLWEVVGRNPNKNDYQYIVATVFKNFSDWLSEYKNSDSKVFYSITKGRLDSVATKKYDSFEIVYTPIFEILEEAGSINKQPQYLLNKYIKATSGKQVAYESLEMDDWFPIHKDLIKKGYETAYSLNRLIYPGVSSPYNYNTLLFFNDEAMFDKQNDIDYTPYMQANQGAFINTSTLRTEVHSELLKLVTVLENGK
jgi:hypothetical protein